MGWMKRVESFVDKNILSGEVETLQNGYTESQKRLDEVQAHAVRIDKILLSLVDDLSKNRNGNGH